MDEWGRVRVSAERRGALLEEFDRSALSGAAFAQWAGVKYSTFAGWLHQRRKRGGSAVGMGNKQSVSWAEVAVVVEDPREVAGRGTRLSVRLPGGASLELDGGRETLRLAAEFLRELERVGGSAGAEGGQAC